MGSIENWPGSNLVMIVRVQKKMPFKMTTGFQVTFHLDVCRGLDSGVKLIKYSFFC